MSDLPDRISVLRRRAGIIAALRHFFDQRGYLAVETPQLCRTPIPEAHIELFETHRTGTADDAGTRGDSGTAKDVGDTLWLLPSPEYYLKQLLAAGSGNLYEITHSFRDGEAIGRHHDIEFTMLEFYTVDADSDRSLEITRHLLRKSGEATPPVTRTMQELWAQFVGIDLAATIHVVPNAPLPTGNRERLAEAIHAAGLSLAVSPKDSWEDLFQRVFLTYVEPELPRDRPVFVVDYPAPVSTLARLRPGTPWADRWELYLGGVEVANCYGEETDPERIERFFREQQREKQLLGRRQHPVNNAYLSAPRLPHCSGVALGVDRLVMHLLGADTMGEVVTFRP